MRRRKRNLLFNNLLRDSVTECYQTASRRAGRASDALRRQDRFTASTGTALLVGVGIGVGIGVLIAPASGEQTRADISEKVSDLRDKVRERSSRRGPQGATGTYGE